VQLTSVYDSYNCVIFLRALEGGRDGEREKRRRRCDSKKMKVHAENIYHRGPEVSLLEECPIGHFVSYSPTTVF
jgi:hypothetical protein